MKFFYENKGLSVSTVYGTSLSFGAHLHNHIEFVYMISGNAKAFVDFSEYIICGGDAFIVFPNKIHQYEKIDYENYFISIFPPDLCPEFQNIFKYKVPVSPVIKNASGNNKLLPLIQNIAETNKEQRPYHDTIMKGYYLILLSELFQMTEFEEAKSSDGNALKAIINYCTENYTGDIQLETVSRALHISKYYISHIFSQKLHIGFSEYIGMLRISDACNLLANREKNITEVAYAVGFNTIRSFNRIFLKYTGITPRQFKHLRFLSQSQPG